MITGHRALFIRRCLERGYTLDDVRGCIVAENGYQITVDETHPSYPLVRRNGGIKPPAASGPGTELKRLLGRIGITASPTCGCNAKARAMDARGCDWCEANLDTVVGWLREEAGKRRLPFLDAVGKMLVRRAISNARKEQRRATETTDGTSEGSGSTV